MKLYSLCQRPEPYAPSASIWTDAHIANQMLEAHLDDANDAASYRTERRERVCAHLYEALGLRAGSRLLDLGCGPGLYCAWYARKGVRVSGVDFSLNSIEYARAESARHSLDIEYTVGDYRHTLGQDRYDAAIYISEDYGVLCPADRAQVLANIHASLHAGGRLALDVMSEAALGELSEEPTWYAVESGFMRPHPHVVLEKTFLYPEQHAYCGTYIVCDQQETVYYTHGTVFTPESISKELTDAGFEIEVVLGGLDGKPYDKKGRQIGVIARKAAEV